MNEWHPDQGTEWPVSWPPFHCRSFHSGPGATARDRLSSSWAAGGLLSQFAPELSLSLRDAAISGPD